MERRLAAVLAADVVGYSRLMGENETGTIERLKSLRKELMQPKVKERKGRIVKLMGDGLLAEFPSAVEAVQCAVEIQRTMAERDANVPEEQRITYRIGINIGDIVVDDDDIYGDGVNVAARLEGLCEPGGICVARNVFDQVKGKLDLGFEHLGEREVKNIAEPISIYRVNLDDRAARLVTAVQVAVPRRRTQTALIAAGVVALIVVAGLAWWQPWSVATPVKSVSISGYKQPALVVLPFANMSANGNLDYFSDGITEDIITELSKNPDLKVTSRSTSFTYRGKAVSARQVSEELGVRYVLEGSVRKEGDAVRITAQLIDGATDAHLWAESFDDKGVDIIDLQDRIATKIGATLTGNEGRIKKAEYTRAWEMDAAKLQEYDYYLRGHSIFYEFTPEAMLKARAIWQEGLEKFPQSGLLRIKIGWTHFQFFYRGWSADPYLDLARAYELVQEGLTDQYLPPVGQWVGHWLNAAVQLFYKRDYDTALQEAKTTIDIVPNDSETLAFLAAVANYSGYPDLALEWSTRAINRETQVPEWYYVDLGRAYQLKGDCERAIIELKKIPWSDIDNGTALASCYVKLGQLDEARNELAKVLHGWPNLTAKNLREEQPFKDDHYFDQFQSALVLAGLPE